VYALTAQRDVAFWDTGEMQTVPWIAGIAHPTGFPLFVMLGWAFSHALPLGSVAWRLSFFSSLAVVLAAWFLFAAVNDQTSRPWIGCGAAIVFETAHTVWARATRAEVHDLELLFAAASIFFMLRFYRGSSRRGFVYSVGSLGCALAVHPVALFVIPGLAVLGVARRRQLDPKTFLAALGSGTIALAAYAYLPLRSIIVAKGRLDPTLALGLPPGQPFWDYAHPADPSRFWWLVRGAQFHTAEGFAGYVQPALLADAFGRALAMLQGDIGPVASALAAVGVVALVRRDSRLGAAWALFSLAAVPFSFSYAQEADPFRYLLGFDFAVTALAGIGCATLVSLAQRLTAAKTVWGVVGVWLLLGIGGWNIYRNLDIPTVNADTRAREMLARVAADSSPHSIVVADWTYATALAYGAYVDGTLGPRLVVAARLAESGTNIRVWSQRYCVLVVADSRTPDFAGTPVQTRALNASVPYVFSVDSHGGPRCDLRGTSRGSAH
jgi:hypothetical protein